LTVRFGGVVAVDDVSLEVAPGEIVGLIGPNGAGKTTVIDAITGFVRPASGTVSIDGERIDSWPVHRRVVAGISRSFQSLELFEQSTVRENVQVACDARDTAAYVRDMVAPTERRLTDGAVSALREFDLVDDLDTIASELPYGRRRLTAIARAVAVGPSLLLLDEPAAGLGDVESAELGVLLRRLVSERGIGVLVVEHDMRFIGAVCDRIVVLDFGRKIADGPQEIVLQDPAVVAAYLGSPEPEAARETAAATTVA
jgi:sulfate-transporting ATPase